MDTRVIDKADADHVITTVTPLPKLTCFVLCMLNLNEAFQINLIWPFVPFMVDGFFPGSDSVGLYVGILASSFFVAQFLACIVWGHLADKYGRRPTLLIGIFLSTGAMLLFGFSTTYWMAILGRVCAGGLNGGIGITKCYIGEICDRTNQAQGYSLLALVWGVGAATAPIFGGFLSRPADSIGGFDTPFWRTYPYLLPVLANTFLTVSAFVAGCLFLPETRVWLIRQGKLAEDHSDKPVAVHYTQKDDQQATEDGEDADTSSVGLDEVKTADSVITVEGDPLAFSHSTRRPRECWYCFCWPCFPPLLQDRYVLIATSLYGFVAFTQTCYDELFPLFAQESKSKGGLEWPENNIGIALSIYGVATLLFQAFIFAPLSRRVSYLRMFWVAIVLQIPWYAGFPALQFLNDETVLWATLIPALLLKSVLSCCAFTTVFILQNNASTTANRGLVAGFGQSCASAGRALGPLVAGGVWSWSVDLELTFVNATAFGVVAVVCVWPFLMALTTDTRLNTPHPSA